MHDFFNNLSSLQITNIQYNVISLCTILYQTKKINHHLRVWNSVPVEICHMSKMNLKHKVHNLLLQKFLKPDNYIDLLDLIKDLKHLENSVYYTGIIHPAVVNII